MINRLSVVPYFKTYLWRLVPPHFRPQEVAKRFVNTVSSDGVASGPFRGMHYRVTSLNSAWYPKAIGLYERELHDVIEECIQGQPDLIVDVGAAEGYYAVGLALRLPNARVVAFEASDHDSIRELADRNGVMNRIEILGLCDLGSLANALTGSDNTLLVMDIEGTESVLLDPAYVPTLRTATILVESHDIFLPGISRLLCDRFKRTHSIQLIEARPPDAADLPMKIPRHLGCDLTQYVVSLMWERPLPMHWLYMKPLPKATD